MNTKKENLFPGALLDTRDKEEKSKDYKFNEIVASAEPVNWVEKPQENWAKYRIFHQNGSGSCVAQSIRKMMGILHYLKDGVFIDFSATHVYQRRSNRPNGGMIGTNALDIATEGVTLNQLVPSDLLNDEVMDDMIIEPYEEDIGKIFKINGYVQPPIKDIDAIASIIQKTGKGVMVWFYFNREEWTSVPEIKDHYLASNGPSTLRHSVVAVDFTLYQGKKALIIDESWGDTYGLNGQRVITEDFFKIRNLFAAYIVNFKFEEEDGNKPKYQFIKSLFFQGKNDKEDVVALQDILKYEGLFPLNTDSTGHYGSITAGAVLKFQKKHKVSAISNLDELKGRIVGPKTRNKLNELYA